MPLQDLSVSVDTAEAPREVRRFLAEAERRIEQFRGECRAPGFVPSDYASAYRVLRALADANLAPGPLFCEWGSGFGVVACLAALLEFEAFGIEIERELVDASRQLAEAFDLPVEFYHGSFIPESGAVCLETNDEFAWLTPEVGRSEVESGLGAEDFDIIYAYPWPDEERLTAEVFHRCAAYGAILVTHHGSEDYRLRRKIRGRRSSSQNRGR